MLIQSCVLLVITHWENFQMLFISKIRLTQSGDRRHAWVKTAGCSRIFADRTVGDFLQTQPEIVMVPASSVGRLITTRNDARDQWGRCKHRDVFRSHLLSAALLQSLPFSLSFQASSLTYLCVFLLYHVHR